VVAGGPTIVSTAPRFAARAAKQGENLVVVGGNRNTFTSDLHYSVHWLISGRLCAPT
jgi:hypothetical protein